MSYLSGLQRVGAPSTLVKWSAELEHSETRALGTFRSIWTINTNWFLINLDCEIFIIYSMFKYVNRFDLHCESQQMMYASSICSGLKWSNVTILLHNPCLRYFLNMSGDRKSKDGWKINFVVVRSCAVLSGAVSWMSETCLKLIEWSENTRDKWMIYTNTGNNLQDISSFMTRAAAPTDKAISVKVSYILVRLVTNGWEKLASV